MFQNQNLKITTIIILVLLAGNAFFGFKYLSAVKELRQNEAVAESGKYNDKVLEFTQLFIKDVLKAENEVSFDVRLKLETAVRDLNDEQILEQWQKFIESQTEKQAQEEVKNLLEMLVDKIKS